MDLRCWMALATRALATIGSNLGLPHKRETLGANGMALPLESGSQSSEPQSCWLWL